MVAGVRRWLRWGGMLAPHGVWLLVRWWMTGREVPSVPRDLLRTNADLLNSQAGQRCFILGNGPSAKQLDLSQLQGEMVFSVSNGYLHRDFSLIHPQFHCVPQITYGRMTEADVVSWFGEMHAGIGDAVLFLSDTEAELVRRHGLFPGREVHYLALRDSFDERSSNDIVDLCGPVPRIESAPIMVLMIAMYMGFKEIYLLGIDHDQFKTGVYQYAFDLGVQRDKDFSVDKNGVIVTSHHDDFQSLARLWRQYRALRRIAHANGIRIANASPGGELDEFPRVPFEQVLRQSA